jgi:hypothetical protein
MTTFYAWLRFTERSNPRRRAIADFQFFRSIGSFFRGLDLLSLTGFALAAIVYCDGLQRSKFLGSVS